MMKKVKRSKKNIGKTVMYISGPRKLRRTIITGFRGDDEPGVPNVTLSDGNSVPARVLRIVEGGEEDGL